MFLNFEKQKHHSLKPRPLLSLCDLDDYIHIDHKSQIFSKQIFVYFKQIKESVFDLISKATTLHHNILCFFLLPCYFFCRIFKKRLNYYKTVTKMKQIYNKVRCFSMYFTHKKSKLFLFFSILYIMIIFSE